MGLTPVIPTLESMRQEDCCELKANLSYIVLVLGQSGKQSETLSQKKRIGVWRDGLVVIVLSGDSTLVPRTHIVSS